MNEILLANFRLPRHRQRRALRPRGVRRGLGHRPFSAREPRTQARSAGLAHRLRGVAADERRRRGRGRADSGLQRRDGRTLRATHGCATDRSSSATPTTSSPTSWDPTYSPFGMDDGALRLRRLRHRIHPTRRPGGAARRTGLSTRGACLRGDSRRIRRRGAATAASPRCVPRRGETPPGLRMVAVAGPRIDPDSIPAPQRAEVHGYVPNLHRQLAACDLAVVQG